MTRREYSGLVAAVFSPMDKDGRLNLEQVPAITEFLIQDGVQGFYVCGTTGEGPLLSSQERRDVAQAYVAAVSGRIPVIVQVGHDSLTEARELACHAQQIGADAIAAIPPTYFRPASVDVLIECLAKIASAAPGLPFFYYHIPRLTEVVVDVPEFLERALERLPSLAGVKYSAPTVYELQACLNFAPERYTMLFGCDEMLLSGLCAGVQGAVGSTYNFAAPLYLGIMKAFEQNDLIAARQLQNLSVQMVRVLCRYRAQPAFKATMGLLGFDCGPSRLPLKTLCPEEVRAMKSELEQIGFFQWARRPSRDGE